MGSGNEGLCQLDLSGFQDEVGEWVNYNFPGATLEHQVLQLVEEVGELSSAVNKAANRYRGTPEEHRAKLVDAVGDIQVALAAVCAKTGIRLGLASAKVWSEVSKRDWVKHPRNGVSL